jgi:mono/diheme cytochrome c family protein
MSRVGRMVAVLALAALALGCNPGPYPVDVYPEMHYSPAQRRGEPQRLSPPPAAVPVSGARPAYTFDQARGLRNPTPDTPDTRDHAAAVYGVNCAMCHGTDGHAHTVVADDFRAASAVPPVDFASERVRQRTDGELYWIVANGIGNMLPFGSLLSEDDLWLVVSQVRRLQGPA